jgi:hypothetical protein
MEAGTEPSWRGTQTLPASAAGKAFVTSAAASAVRCRPCYSWECHSGCG